MKDNFTKSLAFVRKDEGGNDEDADDHGGRTSRGITQREYTAWRLEQGKPDSDVWFAPDEEINNIYHDEYWEPYCDLFPNGTDYLYFDMAVNAGPHRAALILQSALGVSVDGRIGPVTRLAAQNITDFKSLVEKFDAQKRAFYISLHQPKFIKGWLNRCDHVAANAMTLI